MKEEQSPYSLEKSTGEFQILIGKNGYLLETDKTVEERRKEIRDLSEDPGKWEIPMELKEFVPPRGYKIPGPDEIKNIKRLSPEDCEKYNMASQSELEEMLLKEGNRVQVEIGGNGSSVLGKTLGQDVLDPLPITLYFDVGVDKGFDFIHFHDLVRGWGGSAAQLNNSPKIIDYMDVYGTLFWWNAGWLPMSDFGAGATNISSIYSESGAWSYPMQDDYFWFDNGTHYFSENYYGGVANFEGYSVCSPIKI